MTVYHCYLCSLKYFLKGSYKCDIRGTYIIIIKPKNRNHPIGKIVAFLSRLKVVYSNLFLKVMYTCFADMHQFSSSSWFDGNILALGIFCVCCWFPGVFFLSVFVRPVFLLVDLQTLIL